MPRPTSSAFDPGTTIGPYTLAKRIGVGGMGEVYEASSPRSRDAVAIKLITDAAIRSPEARARFVREGELLRELSHPGIVPVYDHGIDPATSTPYLVMELLEGDDLEATVERLGRLSTETVVAIGLALVNALAHAHSRGVVHRDIKPANVLLPRRTDRGRAVLCDFGLSKRMGPNESITGTGAMLGTPHYMSPEQFLDSKRVDALSDVFGLAMTLFFALAARNPLEDLAGIELMTALCSKPVVDIRTLAPDVPADIAVALAGALATDPRNRSSLAEFGAALEACSASAADPKRLAGARRTEDSSTLRTRVAPKRGGPPSLMDALVLENGTYSVMDALANDSYEGVDAEGSVVRIERIAGVYMHDDSRDELEREVAALRSLETESIVACLDWGAVAGDAYLVSEAPDALDLARLVETTGPLDYSDGLRYFAKAAADIGALHALGIYHGHLTPESFYLRSLPSGRTVLVLHDLGVGKRLRAFLAKPEAKRRVVPKDPRLDVLHFVTALHFAVVGQLPFSVGGPRDPEAVRGEAQTFLAPEPHVRRALEALLKHAMQGFISSFRVLGDELTAMMVDSASGA